MNWIKDLIPNIKQNFSKTLGVTKIVKFLKVFGNLAINVDLFFIYLSWRIHMYVQSVEIISKLMLQKELQSHSIVIAIKVWMKMKSLKII